MNLRDESIITFSALGSQHLFDIFNIETKSFDTPWSIQSFKELISQDHYGNSGAFLNHVLVGYCFYYWVENIVHIVNLAVSPTQRQKGIACALVGELEVWMKHHQRDQLFLEVSVKNKKAILLYHKLGFFKQMRRSRYYQNGDDAWLMCKDLKK